MILYNECLLLKDSGISGKENKYLLKEFIKLRILWKHTVEIIYDWIESKLQLK